MEAIRSAGGAVLQFVPPHLQEDRDIVKTAVQDMGAALEFAPPHLRADPELAGAAVRQSSAAFPWVGDELRMEGGLLKSLARETARREAAADNTYFLPRPSLSAR